MGLIFFSFKTSVSVRNLTSSTKIRFAIRQAWSGHLPEDAGDLVDANTFAAKNGPKSWHGWAGCDHVWEPRLDDN